MSIYKNSILFLTFLFSFFIGNGQNAIELIDSLKTKSVNVEKSLIAINKDLKNYAITPINKAFLLEYKADLLKQEENIYEAIKLYQKSYENYASVKNDSLQIKVLNKVSDLYIKVEDYSSAISSLNLVEKLLESTTANNNFTSSRYFVNMAKMYFKIGKTKKAKKHFLKSLKLANKNNRIELLHQHYLDYAQFNLDTKKIDSALYYANKTLIYSKEKNNKILKANAYTLKGVIYEHEKDYILAEKQYQDAIIVLNNIGSNTAHEYKKLGNFYTQVYLYDYANENLLKAERKIKEIDDINELENLYHDLLENAILQNKTKKAKYYLKKYDSIADIQAKTIQKNKIHYINERYGIQQTEINFLNDRNTLLKKENELINQKRIAKKNRLINIIIIALLIALGFTGYQYYKYSKLHFEKSNIQLKNTVLRLQMNPHFIFNSLTAIQNSILKNDQLKSAELIAIFSKLIRQNLDFSNKKSISLDDEIDMLTNYLETQKFRFNNIFNFTIDIDKNIDSEETQVPPMLLQPFVENSIEHGLKHIDKNGKIIIKFVKIEDGIHISIQDNGIGRKSAALNNKNNDDKDKIHAIKIFKERLKIRQKKEIDNFVIKDVLDKKKRVVGTIVEFNLMD